MALDAALRETLLRLTPEEKTEVLSLLDMNESAVSTSGRSTERPSGLDRDQRPVAPEANLPHRESAWLAAMERSREAFAREGVTIDAVAEVRAIRDEI